MKNGGETLYISDLDGTLLNSRQSVSERSESIIRSLIGEGMQFTYATARSYVTASQITRGLGIRLPVILNNGAVAYDPIAERSVLQSSFDRDKFFDILSVLEDLRLSPIVYYRHGERERFSYVPYRVSPETAAFLEGKRGDCRALPVDSADKLYSGVPYYFVSIGEEERVLSAYRELEKRCTCVTYVDIYSGDRWLEIMPDGADKASAALKLKKRLGAKRLVVFGDGANDVSLFEAADECYAVENADSRLKQIADGIIGSNQDDGVALWLKDHADV